MTTRASGSLAPDYRSVVLLAGALLLGGGVLPVAAQEAAAPPPPDDQGPAAVNAPDARRACDGCPPRRIGMSLLQATGINVFYEIANLARGQVTALITPKTWWANMQQGWEWDLDDFTVNQIGRKGRAITTTDPGRISARSPA
jgi:hypothetical protein